MYPQPFRLNKINHPNTSAARAAAAIKTESCALFIVPTAVEVAREQAFLAEKDISNVDETEVLNEFNLVQMSNV